MSVVFFKDSSKRYSDLISKEFAADENKFKFTGKSGDMTFEATLSSKGEATTGTLAPKYEYKPYKATFSGAVNTKKDYKFEVSVKDPFPGAKLTLTSQVGDKGHVATAALEFKKDLAAVTLSGDFGNSNGSNIKASTNLNVWKQLSLGGSAHYLHGTSGGVKEVKGAVTWATDDYDVSASLSTKGDKNEIGVNYFHKVNSNLSVGTEITLDPQNTDAKKDTRMSFGAQYRLDENATVKAKVDVTGKIGLSYLQKLNKASSLGLAAIIDSNHFSNKNTTQFGFSVTLE